jgi:acetyl esterase/lipase
VRPATIPYGDDVSQFVELTVPDGAPRGAVVVIHGGFWKAAYDLSLGRPLVPDLVERGWAALNVEYRRVGAAGPGGGGGVPQTLEDVRAAIATLDGTGLDLATVVALGHSAGGHLAAWAGQAVDSVTDVVSQAGVLDLAAADRDGQGDGAVRAFLGHPVGPDDAAVDPRQHVPLGVPIWCVHAPDDDTVPFGYSADFVEATRAAGGRAELVEVTGGHYEMIHPPSPAWDRTLAIFDEIS